MESETPKKRRGAPKGGWPSQKAKKAKAALTLAPEPVESIVDAPKQYAFMVEQEKEGENLFRCVMLTLIGNRIVKKDYMSGADFKRNTMHKVLYCLTQIHCNDRIPESLDMLPTQGAQSHG